MNKKYNHWDGILHEIQAQFIRLPHHEVGKNNQILREVLNIIEQKMKQSALFTELYLERFYAGSFYDGLRVGHPSEFDIIFKLKLPTTLKAKAIKAKEAGFLHVRLYGLHKIRNSKPFKDIYGHFLDACVSKKKRLLAPKISSWFRGLIDSCLSDILEGNFYVFHTSVGTFRAKRIQESGPAQTLKIVGLMDIDLVPGFVFDNSWPVGYRCNPFPEEPEFFLVPKPYRGQNKWRPSFRLQEQLLIGNLQHLKPIGKLLKQVRDVLKHKKIASYYIKTLLLRAVWERPRSYWKNSISILFMDFLHVYEECLHKHEILYFWNEEYNLLGKVNPEYSKNIGNQVTKKINKIEGNPWNPDGILECLVEPKYRQYYWRT